MIARVSTATLPLSPFDQILEMIRQDERDRTTPATTEAPADPTPDAATTTTTDATPSSDS